MWIFLGIVSFTMFFGYGLWRRMTWAIGWPDDNGHLLTAADQRYKFKVTTQNNLRTFYYAVPCAPGVSLRIHRESRWDRFAKKIGLSYEYQFNDPEFDNDLYVVSNAPCIPRGAGRDQSAARCGAPAVSRLPLETHRMPRAACGGALSGEGRERSHPQTEQNRAAADHRCLIRPLRIAEERESEEQIALGHLRVACDAAGCAVHCPARRRHCGVLPHPLAGAHADHAGRGRSGRVLDDVRSGDVVRAC